MINQMMRYINQRWRTIITVIVLVAFFYIGFRVVVNIARNTKKKQMEAMMSEQYQNTTESTTQNENGQTTTKGNTNTTINKSNTISGVINQFIQFCNENNVEQAYELLSNDCKQALFPTLQAFNNNYYQKIFTSSKSYTIQQSMYATDIYQITFFDNALLTGGNNAANSIQDYMFVKNENGSLKISVNKFLYSETLNQMQQVDGIQIKLLQKQVYSEYETYQIQVINNTKQAILLDSKTETNSVYLLDESDTKYASNIDEFAEERLTISADSGMHFSIRFEKLYNTDRKTKTVCFSDIIKNYNDIKQGSQKEIIKIKINL